MDRCLAGGDRAASYDEFENWDLALHRSIMAASHSPLLGQLYAVIETARHGHSWGDLKRRSASRERREQVPGRSRRARRRAAGPRQRPRDRGDAHAPGPGATTTCSARRPRPQPGPTPGRSPPSPPRRARDPPRAPRRAVHRAGQWGRPRGRGAVPAATPVAAARGRADGAVNRMHDRAGRTAARLTLITCHTPSTPLPLTWPGATSPA